MTFQILEKPPSNTLKDPTGEIYDLLSTNFKCFSTKQEIYDIQTKLRCKEFVDAIHHLMDTIQNQQHKQWDFVITLVQLYIDFTREKTGMTLSVDQQVTAIPSAKSERTRQNYNSKQNKDFKVNKQL